MGLETYVVLHFFENLESIPKFYAAFKVETSSSLALYSLVLYTMRSRDWVPDQDQIEKFRIIA